MRARNVGQAGAVPTSAGLPLASSCRNRMVGPARVFFIANKAPPPPPPAAPSSAGLPFASSCRNRMVGPPWGPHSPLRLHASWCDSWADAGYIPSHRHQPRSRGAAAGIRASGRLGTLSRKGAANLAESFLAYLEATSGAPLANLEPFCSRQALSVDSKRSFETLEIHCERAVCQDVRRALRIQSFIGRYV